MEGERIKDMEKEIIHARELIFNAWLHEELIPIMPVEAVNQTELLGILEEAHTHGSILPMICVGCQPLVEVAVDNSGGIMAVPSKLRTRKGKRADRWAEGMASFQKACQSFSINTTVFLSLSDTQVLSQTIDFGLEIQAVQPQIMRENINVLTELLKGKGVSAIPFIHSEALIQGSDSKSFLDLIHFLIPDWKGEKLTDMTRDVLDPLSLSLYDADPVLIPKSLLLPEDMQRLIWIDMMSDLASVDRKLLLESMGKHLPNTPIITPTNNAGKWNSAGEEIIRFRDRLEFISLMLGIGDVTFKEASEWLKSVHNRVEDKSLVEFFERLGISFCISNLGERENGIRLLEKIVFDQETFKSKSTKEVPFVGKRIKNLISELTNVPTGQVFAQLNNGSVKVNGVIIKDINFIPQVGDIISIGKKVEITIV